jgi:UPF0716 protein FxsA
MLIKLFLAFTLIPMLELYLLLKIGSSIGAWTTIGLVIITGFAGASLARLQGAKTMLNVKANLDQGIMPAEELLDALIIFMAGVVLLTPGFITDIFGLLLLYPPSRFVFKRYARKKFDQWSQRQNLPPQQFH